MVCIFCDEENDAQSIEHIVPESFGNKNYIIDKGAVCDGCNKRFSTFEGKALINTVFIMERAILGMPSKKGKNAKGRIGKMHISGDENFRKGIINIQGLTPEDFLSINHEANSGELIVAGFDKSESATSKLLLMMGLESLFQSRRKLFRQYDFTELKQHLTNKNNKDWLFVTTEATPYHFQSVPRFTDKLNLSKIKCFLEFHELNTETLLFRFKFGGISMVINLLNRDTSWTGEFLAQDEDAQVYLERTRNRRVDSMKN